MRQVHDTTPSQEHVLSAAVRVARRSGWSAVTREAVAAECGLSTGTVSNAFRTMGALRTEVMCVAVTAGDLPIVAEGLAAREPVCINASPELKRRALDTLA